MLRLQTIAGPIRTEPVGQEAFAAGFGEEVCHYLPDQRARFESYLVDELPPAIYEHLLQMGFRRCGRVVYRPRCRTCAECRTSRIQVERFQASRSQERVRRLNRDLRVEVGSPEACDEKYALFLGYQRDRHPSSPPNSWASFLEFLYDSPTDSLEFDYYLGRRLIGVSIADCGPTWLSSVYMYFDPSYSRRSLGTYSVLHELESCRRHGWTHYYLGYYVAKCRSMNYKARFRPCEVLRGDGRWEMIPSGSP